MESDEQEEYYDNVLPKVQTNLQSNYKQIQTLLHLNSSKSLNDIKLQFKKTQFFQKKEDIPSAKMQLELMVKTVIQDHLNIIKINQLKYYSVTKKGMRNFEVLQNQDVILIDKLALGYKIFAIFDGFGQFGRLIAQCVSHAFKNYLKSFEEQFKRDISKKQIQAIVKQCIKKTQNYLISHKFNQANYSGTTALIALISMNQIFIFNMGNSRAVLGLQKSNAITDYQVTHDQDLSRLDERLRVIKYGAHINKLKDEYGQGYGPERLWNKDQMRPGTYITRAFGLLCGSKSGITSQPEVSVLAYKSNMKFLVLGSDGLWAVQQNDEVVQYLQHYYSQKHMQMGVTSLLDQAVKRWKTEQELMDDITIIVITLS